MDLSMQQYLRPLLQRIKPLLQHPRAALIAGATAAAATFTYLLARRRRHSLRYVGFEGTYNGRARICNSPIGGRHSRIAEEDATYNGAIDLEGTELIIVRHGKTVWNEQGKVQGACDSPLVRDGKTGAKAVGRRLRHSTRPIVAIYASPLGRAWKTAELIARGMGFRDKLIPDYDLRERAFGVLEGLTWQEMQKQQPEAHHAGLARHHNKCSPRCSPVAAHRYRGSRAGQDRSQPPGVDPASQPGTSSPRNDPSLQPLQRAPTARRAVLGRLRRPAGRRPRASALALPSPPAGHSGRLTRF